MAIHSKAIERKALKQRTARAPATISSALVQKTLEQRGVLRRIISDTIKAKYDPLEPSQRTDFERQDIAARIITNIEKAGWVLDNPKRIYYPFE